MNSDQDYSNKFTSLHDFTFALGLCSLTIVTLCLEEEMFPRHQIPEWEEEKYEDSHQPCWQHGGHLHLQIDKTEKLCKLSNIGNKTVYCHINFTNYVNLESHWWLIFMKCCDGKTFMVYLPNIPYCQSSAKLTVELLVIMSSPSIFKQHYY